MHPLPSALPTYKTCICVPLTGAPAAVALVAGPVAAAPDAAALVAVAAASGATPVAMAGAAPVATAAQTGADTASLDNSKQLTDEPALPLVVLAPVSHDAGAPVQPSAVANISAQATAGAQVVTCWLLHGDMSQASHMRHQCCVQIANPF